MVNPAPSTPQPYIAALGGFAATAAFAITGPAAIFASASIGLLTTLYDMFFGCAPAAPVTWQQAAGQVAIAARLRRAAG